MYIEHRALARYWLPPIVLATLVTALAVWLVFEHRADLLGALWSAPPTGDGLWSDVLRWLRSALGFVLTGVGGALYLLMTSISNRVFNRAEARVGRSFKRNFARN